MKTWIVYWIIMTVFQVPCPDAVKVDEYGINHYYGCCALHMDSIKREHSKIFNDRNSALDFVEKMPREDYIIGLGDFITEWRVVYGTITIAEYNHLWKK